MFDSHLGKKIFSLPRAVPCFPLLGLTPSGLFMGLSSTIIYTSELILCSTICVPSATRHNIHMYPSFHFHYQSTDKSLLINKKRPSSHIEKLQVDNKQYEQPLTISNCRNNFFCNVPSSTPA